MTTGGFFFEGGEVNEKLLDEIEKLLKKYEGKVIRFPPLFIFILKDKEKK